MYQRVFGQGFFRVCLMHAGALRRRLRLCPCLRILCLYYLLRLHKRGRFHQKGQALCRKPPCSNIELFQICLYRHMQRQGYINHLQIPHFLYHCCSGKALSFLRLLILRQGNHRHYSCLRTLLLSLQFPLHNMP
ncbi:hypothetical protein SDC9_195870 [bioreactor metagenome]|uniref:Uncharacterized protein n=1 Tax=bioreactor metagenome TaxID=1076179 RepID=A0A645IIY1_9ZZZZ